MSFPRPAAGWKHGDLERGDARFLQSGGVKHPAAVDTGATVQNQHRRQLAADAGRTSVAALHIPYAVVANGGARNGDRLARGLELRPRESRHCECHEQRLHEPSAPESQAAITWLKRSGCSDITQWPVSNSTTELAGCARS